MADRLKFGRAAPLVAHFMGSHSFTTYPGFRKKRYTRGFILSPAFAG